MGVGQVGAILLFIIFVANWFVWLGAFVSDIGADTVTANNLTGETAFFLNNLNFVILICMFLGMMGWMYFSTVSG